MPRFFVKTKQINDNKILINNEDVKHIKNVLRKNINDEIEICNQDTEESYIAKIIKITDKEIESTIIKTLDSNTESNVHINIFQGLPKADKMELIIQKSIELGASEITPVSMKRCVVKLDEKSENKKIDRWQKIAESAAKQSDRNIIPKINTVKSIKNICENCSQYDIVLVAYENEKQNTLKKELKQLNKSNKKIKIAIIIGPEGGLEETEVKQLKDSGAKVITLGQRILRTETVALSMCSIIMYELEQ